MILLTVLCTTNVQATTWYVNSVTGNDSATGNSLRLPWRTLLNPGTKQFQPGDSILFAAGTNYTGGFVFNSSGTADKPIVIGAYAADASTVINNQREQLSPVFLELGAGPAPAFSNPGWEHLNGNVIRLEGSHVIVDGLYFHDNVNPPGSDKKNQNVQKLGAIYLSPGADHSLIRNCEFFRTPVAIKIKSSYNLVFKNYMHDASGMMAQSWGPIAIMIVSPYNEIANNRIENYGAYGGPYGSDGGVIELDGVDTLFNAHSISVHHNISINNHGFLEIAARNVDTIIVAYNLSDDRNQFIGGGSMKNVLVINNTVIRNREPNVDRFIFWTFYPEGCSFTVLNNIFVIPADMQVFGPVRSTAGHKRTGIGEQQRNSNLYYSPGNADPVGVSKRSDDLIADPEFIDLKNRNFRLTAASPAIFAAFRPASNKLKTSAPVKTKTDLKIQQALRNISCLQTDLDGYSTGRNNGYDLGAYDY